MHVRDCNFDDAIESKMNSWLALAADRVADKYQRAAARRNYRFLIRKYPQIAAAHNYSERSLTR